MTAPLGTARSVAEAVLERLRPHVKRAMIAGSIRRQRPEVKDIEIVAEPNDVPDGMFGETRPGSLEVREVVARLGHVSKGGEKYIQVRDILGSGIALDLFLLTPPASWGALVAIRTGPAPYSEMLVTRLRGRLLRCERGRVLRGVDEVIPTETEEAFFEACGVPWVPPEERGAP